MTTKINLWKFCLNALQPLYLKAHVTLVTSAQLHCLKNVASFRRHNTLNLTPAITVGSDELADFRQGSLDTFTGILVHHLLFRCILNLPLVSFADIDNIGKKKRHSRNNYTI